MLLVHGLGASLAVWGENIGPLAEIGSVYAIDLPGHGKSDKPSGLRYDPVAGGHFLMSLMDALGLQRAVLVGNSAGGLVSSWSAINYPDRVRGLVLVDSAGLDRRMPWFFRLSTVPKLGELLHSPAALNGPNMAKSVFHRPRPADERLLHDLAASRNNPDAKRAELESIRSGINVLGLKKEMMVLTGLSGLGRPIMVIWGGEDRIFPVSHAQRALKALTVGPMHVIPDAGHWPMLEKSREFNRLAASFIKGIED